jgi:hypothetical protein
VLGAGKCLSGASDVSFGADVAATIGGVIGAGLLATLECVFGVHKSITTKGVFVAAKRLVGPGSAATRSAVFGVEDQLILMGRLEWANPFFTRPTAR